MVRRIDSKGVIAIIAAIALPVLLVLASGAIDLGRTYVVKQRLQTGVDAAALVAQVNATNATPETACQSTGTMSAALNANLTSNGFLGTAPPTLVSCTYDATAQKIVVTATVNVNNTIGFTPAVVTATGYATLNTTQSNASQWIALYCYGNTNISSKSSCQGYSSLTIDQPASSSAAVSVTGPVCQSSIQSNQTLGTDCETYNSDPALYVNTSANLSGSTVNTTGASCPQCNKAYFDQNAIISSGTTTVTNLGLYFSGGGNSSFTLDPGSSLVVGQDGLICDNGFTANNASITVTSGGTLGCQNWQSSHIEIDNSSSLNVSSGSTIYEREMIINGSSATISDSTATVTDQATVNSSSIAFINSTLSIKNYFSPVSSSVSFSNTIAQISGFGPNTSQDAITIASGSQLTFGSTNTTLQSLSITESGSSSLTFNAYTTVNNAKITVTSNSTVNFNGQTPLQNVTIDVEGGSTVVFQNASSLSGVQFTISGGSTVILKNINPWTTSGVSGQVSDTGSTITFVTSSGSGLDVLKQNVQISQQNGGKLIMQ